MKKIKSYKNIKKTKKKKSNNNLKKIRVKILVKNLQIQQKKYIKETINNYIKRMIKDLNDKVFNHYIYTEYYDIVLDFIQRLKPKKISSITFNKKLRILKKHLV